MNNQKQSFGNKEFFSIYDYKARSGHNQFGPIDITEVCPRQHTQVHFRSEYYNTFILKQREDNNLEYDVAFGFAICPRSDCKGIVQIINRPISPIITQVYPPSYIDFDDTDIPVSIVKMLREATICHGNECYTAAAIMIRRTLEELCNLNGAKKPNLYDRIQELGSKITLPNDFLTGMN